MLRWYVTILWPTYTDLVNFKSIWHYRSRIFLFFFISTRVEDYLKTFLKYWCLDESNELIDMAARMPYIWRLHLICRLKYTGKSNP